MSQRDQSHDEFLERYYQRLLRFQQFLMKELDSVDAELVELEELLPDGDEPPETNPKLV